jgi:hypothetical protein
MMGATITTTHVVVTITSGDRVTSILIGCFQNLITTVFNTFGEIELTRM